MAFGNGPIIGIILYIFHEGTVNFQAMNRELFQVIERRIANPKIIDGDGNSFRTKLIKDSDRLLHILHNRAFGNFELQDRRVEYRFVQ